MVSSAARQTVGSYEELDDEMRSYVRGISRYLARGDRNLADDIEQETFIVALQNRPRDPKAMRAWLRAIARSCLSAALGRPGRRPKSIAYSEPIHDSLTVRVADDPAEAESRAELRRTLDRALRRLPEDYARVITMRVIDGMPPREIAVAMDVPVNTIRTWTRRAFDKLRLDVDCQAMEDQAGQSRPLFGLAFLAFPRARVVAVAVLSLLLVGAFMLVRGSRAGTPVVDTTGSTRSALGDASLAALAPDRAPKAERATVLAAPGPIELQETEEAIAGIPVDVTVVNAEGEPMPGISLYEHVGFHGTVKRVGRTDINGRATVRELGANRWIAARGEPGWTSDAVLLRQPVVHADGKVELLLEEQPVAWLDVDLTARPDRDGRVHLEGQAYDARQLCERRVGGGLRGSSCWLPSWKDAGGRHGVIWGDLRKSLCVFVDGRAIWSAGPFAAMAEAPSRIEVSRPWSLRGRLVSAEGLSIPNKALRFQSGLPLGDTISRVLTDEDGRFDIPGLSLPATTIQTHGLTSQVFKRPDGDVLDAGTVTLSEVAAGLTVHGRVRGVKPPFIVRALTSESSQTPLGLRLAVETGRKFVPIAGPDGSFTFTEAEERVDAIIVHAAQGGPPIPQTIVKRPAAGWPASGVEIEVTEQKAASIKGRLDEGLLPARLLFRNVGTGYRTEVTMPMGDGAFLSPPLSEGTWSLAVQDRTGRYAPIDRFKVAWGEELDLGAVGPRCGTVRVVWPAAYAAAGASEPLYVTLRQGGDILLRKRFSPQSALRELSELELPAGRYRMLVQTKRRFYATAFTVYDQAVTECALLEDAVAISVRLPRQLIKEAAPDAWIELRDADGSVLETVALNASGLLDTRVVDFAAPREFPMEVTICGTTAQRSEQIEDPGRTSQPVIVDWTTR